MKKLFSFLLLLVMALTLTSAADSLVKKKKKIVRRRHYRRIVRNWPQGGPRPVFPKAGDEKAEPVAPASVTAQPAPPVVKPARSGFFAEGGLAGGGLALEAGWQREPSDKLYFSAAAGYIFGAGNGAVVLDPIRFSGDLGAYLVGVGANCAFYSDKNLLGIEVFAAKRFNKMIGRIGYSSALGLRVAAGYEF